MRIVENGRDALGLVSHGSNNGDAIVTGCIGYGTEAGRVGRLQAYIIANDRPGSGLLRIGRSHRSDHRNRFGRLGHISNEAQAVAVFQVFGEDVAKQVDTAQLRLA